MKPGAKSPFRTFAGVAAERPAAGYRAFKLKIGFPDAEGTAVLADDAGLGPTPDWSLLSEFAVSV